MDRLQLVLASALGIGLVLGAVHTVARARYERGFSRRELLLLAACLLVALVPRLAATTFPASMSVVSGQALAGGAAHRWGAGLAAALHLVDLFAPLSVASIAAFNVIVSVATVAALFLFVDAYFEDRFAAFAAAAVLALQPISARYANSDSAIVLQTLCLVAGAAFLAGWSRRGGRLLLLQGIGWLVFAANVRYEAVVYLLAGGLIVVGSGGWPGRGRTRALALGGAFGALFLIYPAARALLDASQGTASLSPLNYLGPFPQSPHSPAAVVALAFIGLAAITLARFRASVSLLLALVVVALPGLYVQLECSAFVHRVALPQLALWAAFAGCGLSAARRLLEGGYQHLRGTRRGWLAEPAVGIPPLAAGAVLLLLLAAALPHRAYLAQTWTHALEYQFVVARLREIPDECLIVGPDSGRESRGLRFSAHLSAEAGRRHRWLRADSPEVLAGDLAPCTYYYRATTCFAYEAVLAPQNPDWAGPERPVCRAIGERFHLEPVATTTFPSRSYTCEAHTVDPVPAGFYRLRPRARGETVRHER